MLKIKNIHKYSQISATNNNQAKSINKKYLQMPANTQRYPQKQPLHKNTHKYTNTCQYYSPVLPIDTTRQVNHVTWVE